MRRNDRTFMVPLRRKRSGKTNYRSRLGLLKAGTSRLVVHRSLNNVLAQIIQYYPTGDKVIVSAHSNELKKLGWKLHRGNTSSAYLVGLLLGEKAKKAKIKDAVLDLGLQPSVKGASLYAAVKGALDAGLHVPCSKDALPSDDRIQGKHVETYANALASRQEAYQRQFNRYLKAGVAPTEIAKHVQEIKTKILKGV